LHNHIFTAEFRNKLNWILLGLCQTTVTNCTTKIHSEAQTGRRTN